MTWWYLARASGLVAWALLMASLVWGVLLATRVLRPVDRPAWLLAMHRWLSGLAVVTTGIHLGALVADTAVPFGWREILVPGASGWRPLAVGLGVVALYLVVAIQATSLLMRRLPRRWWRGVHLASYGLVWLVTVHAGLAGSDTGAIAYRAFALALTIGGVGAALVRVVSGRPQRGAAGSTASGASAASADARAVRPG